MKKSTDMLKAEAEHLRQLEAACREAYNSLQPFYDKGEGGWSLRREFRRLRDLAYSYSKQARAIEKKFEVESPATGLSL